MNQNLTELRLPSEFHFEVTDFNLCRFNGSLADLRIGFNILFDELIDRGYTIDEWYSNENMTRYFKCKINHEPTSLPTYTEPKPKRLT